ncbi:DedA family protein [Deinococcus sonorensis]|uniref:VTT domain-containing protein n=2 Tax=Deinococcus sonorensis TaxID=309891 RepID=A0AAU7U7N6_9DEIO
MDLHALSQVFSLDHFLHWLNTLNPLWVHVVNALLLVAEGIGLPGIPFEISMLASGLLVHQHQTTLLESVLWGGLGNWVGNLIGFELGGRIMNRLPERLRGSMGVPEVQRWMARSGPWVVIISRWFGAIRTPFILYAKAAGMPLRTYALYSLLGALSWTAAWQIGLWYFGSVFIELWHRYQWYVIGGGVVVGLIIWLVMSRRKPQTPAS